MNRSHGDRSSGNQSPDASRREDPHPERIRRTFWAEAVRAVSAGVIETGLATFAVLIAVNRFESGAAVKALLLASPAVGLLGSLVVVPLAVRFGLRSSHAAAIVSGLSALGFVVSAIGARSEFCFVLGIVLGIGVIGMAIPLQTHYLRLNYPASSRGRLFSVTIFIRALVAMGVSWAFGLYLDADFERYPILLWCMAGAAVLSVVCHLAVPSDPLRATTNKRHRFLESVHLSRQDRVFVQLLGASMVLGMGVLSANALRVDYLANPAHGLGYDVKTVSLITGIIPSLVRLISTFFWGWLFDRMNFFRLRIIVNAVFLVALALYYLWPDINLIIIGSALFGLARGGGEILFNLFVTKIAPSDLIADYMSVHTFLAGIRILLAPFLGFLLAQYVSIEAMMAVSAGLMILSIFFVGKASKTRAATGPHAALED